MLFISLSLLRSSPVHKEAKITMNHRDGHDHIAKNSERCNARKQSEDKPQSAEEFCGNGQNCECGRNVQDSHKEAHRAGEAVSTEPPQRLLGAVGEEDHSKRQCEEWWLQCRCRWQSVYQT
jgi:hypothetical protein